jgi:hypothetical protein
MSKGVGEESAGEARTDREAFGEREVGGDTKGNGDVKGDVVVVTGFAFVVGVCAEGEPTVRFSLCGQGEGSGEA